MFLLISLKLKNYIGSHTLRQVLWLPHPSSLVIQVIANPGKNPMELPSCGGPRRVGTAVRPSREKSIEKSTLNPPMSLQKYSAWNECRRILQLTVCVCVLGMWGVYFSWSALQLAVKKQHETTGAKCVQPASQLAQCKWLWLRDILHKTRKMDQECVLLRVPWLHDKKTT